MTEGNRSMTNPFSRATLAVVIGVAGVSLGITVALTLVGDDLAEKRSAGVDGYSVSAIGHKGLVRLLEKLDVPVVVSRSDSGDKAKHGLLIIAEPTVTDDASRDRLTKLVASAPNTLVVLPKWYGSAERGKTWIEDARLDDQVRVSGKNKDDLQAVIKMLREADMKFAMQFTNYR